MNIPVTGYVYHPEEGDKNHKHGLYINSWDGRPVHIHPFSGVTSFDVGHHHAYCGQTEPAPTGVPHVHAYHTVTTLDDGHTHLIRGTTGPAIPLPHGGHIHYFEGITTINGHIPHTHRYRGATGNEA